MHKLLTVRWLAAQKVTVAAMLVMFVFAGSTFAADIDLGENYHVPDGFSSILITSSDGTAIQNAIDHIQPGGTITLSGDFYLKKSLVIKKTLTLKGQANKKAALNATSKDRVIGCKNKVNITLENLKVSGGIAGEGGGINIDNCGTVNIMSCDFTGNIADDGGGMHIHDSNVTATNCKFFNNFASNEGGGLRIDDYSRVILTNCIFSGNQATVTGGGLFLYGGNLTMNNIKFITNSAMRAGSYETRDGTLKDDGKTVLEGNISYLGYGYE